MKIRDQEFGRTLRILAVGGSGEGGGSHVTCCKQMVYFCNKGKPEANMIKL